jgi:hypothetical protein
MAATERLVVLMTPQQKQIVAQRARAENLSLSDYMRRQALGDDELLAGLLGELRASTAAAMEALNHAIVTLEEADAAQAEADARAYEEALAEFADIDAEAFARLVGPPANDASVSSASGRAR